MEEFSVLFALACAVAAIAYGLVSTRWILGLPQGNDRIREIAAATQEGVGVISASIDSNMHKTRK